MTTKPFRRVLVAIDGSFHARIAARYSFVFAEIFGAKLYAATVIAEKRDDKTAALAIERIVEEAHEAGIEAEGVLLTGDVVPAIRKFAEENRVDLVVASTRRPHREKRFFARSITSLLMSELSCHVIGLKITHPGRSIKPRRILVPVIGNGYRDRERTDIIEALTRKFDARITIFHVLELSRLRIKRLDRDDKEKLISSAEQRLLPLSDELRRRGIDFREKIVIGRNAREEIIAEASHQKYDLIIAGTTMRNIVKRFVSGNPVEEILRDTPCDVMLVHFK